MDQPTLLARLTDPACFPEPTTTVDVIQTHISTIFLTDRFAYKVKKPVNFGFLDYTTLERRRHFCEQEVSLNRRLAPEVYLDVVDIRDNGGVVSIGGRGETVEVAVKMVRLPAERMMRSMLERGEVTRAHIEGIAKLLAAFHTKAATGPEIQRLKSLEGVTFNCEENFSQTAPYVGRLLDATTAAFIRTSTLLFLARHAGLFRDRAAQGRVRDGHGDLHLDSICLTEPVRIFDCIEFNDRFRYADVAEEVAFLAMDLEHNGRDDLARAFVDAYVGASGDSQLLDLIDFYKCYRAYVRAKVNAFQSDDADLPAERRTAIAATATAYFQRARQYAESFNPQRLVVTCGLTGTGKSTLARKLASQFSLVVVRSDVVRKELLGLAPNDRCHVPFGEGEYAANTTDRTYAAMLTRARDLLACGHSVVLDGCFIQRDQRAGAVQLGATTGVPLLVLECRADEATVRSRLERRRANPQAVSDGRWEIYRGQLEQFEPPDEIPQHERIVLDRSRPVEELMGTLAEHMPAAWRASDRPA
jgi:hypothetical protein